MKINLKVRMQNKAFWITIISALFVFGTTISSALGLDLDLTQTQDTVMRLIETVFSVLAVLGVVVDPTTKGVSDSERALGYDELG